MKERISKEEKYENERKEAIEEELSDIKDNDTGSLVKLYSSLLVVGTILYSIYVFVVGVIGLVNVESRFIYFWGGIIRFVY